MDETKETTNGARIRSQLRSQTVSKTLNRQQSETPQQAAHRPKKHHHGPKKTPLIKKKSEARDIQYTPGVIRPPRALPNRAHLSTSGNGCSATVRTTRPHGTITPNTLSNHAPQSRPPAIQSWSRRRNIPTSARARSGRRSRRRRSNQYAGSEGVPSAAVTSGSR